MADEKKVVILAFNLGIRGSFVNGPGVSLRNLLIFFKRFYPNISFSIFTKFSVEDTDISANFFKIEDKGMLRKCIEEADVVHCWSGLKKSFLNALVFASERSKPIILGPNLLDGVDAKLEKVFLSKVDWRVLLTANVRLRYLLSKAYSIDGERVMDFMVGPDLDLWRFSEEVDSHILWKGNSKQAVKDIRFAKNVAKKLPKYNFMFIGDKNNFNYIDHIPLARRARLYINTSWSETKGMAQLEQMAAGVPSVVHPQIYCHGENYVTGIITNKTVECYADAIREILEDNSLRLSLRSGARKYVEDNFNAKQIADKYYKIINYVS